MQIMSGKSRRLRIGIVCYPTYGGSGVVATELGIALARRGHEVHFFSYQPPFRLPPGVPRIFFHEVRVPSYPLFRYPSYDLALACTIADVLDRSPLDLLHVHYALPHTLSACLALEMRPGIRTRVLTTLHGTDIALVEDCGAYACATRLALKKSHGLTAVSGFLRDETRRRFFFRGPIEVIPNFVDARVFRPCPAGKRRRPWTRPGEKLMVHLSNFRPVKRTEDAIRVFARVAEDVPSRLLLVGDGPRLPAARELARELGVERRVICLGQQDRVHEVLPLADFFLQTSAFESFGLAALEAMSCGVPVASTACGGPGEFIVDGREGVLAPVGAWTELADKVRALLLSPGDWGRMSRRARKRAGAFSRERAVASYEDCYRRLLREK